MLEVRTGAGDLVWRFDRDGKKPTQAIPASVAADMAEMMSHVVSEGTARRASIDGIPTAGKTGTTNAYRDAWFVGYTGNFTCAVWYGNDDYSPTNRMTGGSLPAQTWREIMVAAHQGVEVKEIPGIGMGKKLPPTPQAAAAMRRRRAEDHRTKPGPPPVLTKRGADILVRVEKAARRRRQDGGEDIGRPSRRSRRSRCRRAPSHSLTALRRRRPTSKAAPAAAQELTRPCG